MKLNIQTKIIKKLSDRHTPVGLYLHIRDKYPNAILLESSENKSKEDSYSYIAFSPLATYKAYKGYASISIRNEEEILDHHQLPIVDQLTKFINYILPEKNEFNLPMQGIFGYTSYDSISLFHPVKINAISENIPLIQYQYFRFIIMFNHFNDELYILENCPNDSSSGLHKVLSVLENTNYSEQKFSTIGSIKSNYTDKEFLKIIQKGKDECFLGNVFQIVLSRNFTIKYNGDDFNVYRSLRSINPSPYLFYFDYGNFKIMGSSPEAQIKVKEGNATIYPIAGTYRRTGNEKEDKILAEQLECDPKENSEHVMLVDMARNDLSINSDQVVVKKIKQIEMYSHVIHLTSEVNGILNQNINPLQVYLDTFPAGTLSGSPKHEAMKKIEKLENTNRGFYGGSIGMIGLDFGINQAIFIRSIVVYKQQLKFQAGCGIVALSDLEKELQEINNKTNAIKKAIELAKNI